jgi:hypothetical protein
MCAQQHISRRQVLHMAMAAGSLAIAGHVRRVGAQTGTRIEQLAPELEQILSPSEPIQMLAEDFLPFVNLNLSNFYPICTTGSR